VNRLPQSYAKVADTMDVYLCTGCGSGDHRRGWAGDGTVHWSERAVTRPGLYRFLRLTAENEGRWPGEYESIRYAEHAAKQHFSVAIRPSEEDVSRLRYLLAHATPLERKTKLYRAAMAWARRWHGKAA
jgi:hypothetical protein